MDHFEKEHYIVLKWEDAVKKQLLPVINSRQIKVKKEEKPEETNLDQIKHLKPIEKAALS